MKVPKIFATVAAILLLTTSAHAAPESIDFVEGVDWTRKVVTATGEGIVPKSVVNYTQAKGLASTAAKADAYRKLGETVNGVRVEGNVTVAKMLTTENKIQMRVQATIKGAKVINETFLSDGGYRVIMQVPLFGVSNSLAGAVIEKTSQREPFPDPVIEIAPSNPQYTSNTPIERRIELTKPTEGNLAPAPSTYKPPLSRKALPTFDALDLKNLQTNATSVQEQPSTRNAPRTMVKKSVEEYASAAKGNYTGLIVDCRGLHLQAVMSPVIKNTNGTAIYGHKNLDVDKIVSMGMVDYVNDITKVARAGENPLVVKAVAVENFNSNPVLSIPDSNRVLIENHATKFLKDLKVVFLFD